MNDKTPTHPTEEEESQSISSLVKEVSAFFHREIKKQKKEEVPSDPLKKRISKGELSPKSDRAV